MQSKLLEKEIWKQLWSLRMQSLRWRGIRRGLKCYSTLRQNLILILAH